jgi:hypothetical protein
MFNTKKVVNRILVDKYSKQDEIVQTGGMKEFVYPKNYKLGDTESSKRFKVMYRTWQEEKNKSQKPFWKFW